MKWGGWLQPALPCVSKGCRATGVREDRGGLVSHMLAASIGIEDAGHQGHWMIMKRKAHPVHDKMIDNRVEFTCLFFMFPFHPALTPAPYVILVILWRQHQPLYSLVSVGEVWVLRTISECLRTIYTIRPQDSTYCLLPCLLSYVTNDILSIVYCLLCLCYVCFRLNGVEGIHPQKAGCVSDLARILVNDARGVCV